MKPRESVEVDLKIKLFLKDQESESESESVEVDLRIKLFLKDQVLGLT